MSRKSLLTLFCGVILSLFSLACETTTNTNTNTNNSNQATLSNTNNNANANTNANSNSNSGNKGVTKDDVAKNMEDYKRQAKELGNKVGDGAEDMWIWVKTRASLAAADDLRDSTIGVDVEQNVVTLNGTVATAAQKTLAEKTAKEIEGVKSVKNMLKISASGDSNTNKTAPKSK